MQITHQEEEVDYKELILRSPLFLGSLSIIILLFTMGKTALFVSFWACVIIVLISMLRKTTRPTLKRFVKGLIGGASLGSSIAVTCGTLGIIVATITGTGLGIKLPAAVGYLCGDNLPLLLVMTAMVSVVLGIGLPASATYLVVAIVLAPLLIDKGVPLLSAHLFAFYFANFSFLTPPVAIAALFGAQLAGAPYMKTGIEAAKVGIAGFVLPFMIIWSPAFLGDFSNPIVALGQLMLCVLVFLGLQSGFVGFFLTRMMFWERGSVIAGSLILVAYLYTKRFTWFGFGLCLLMIPFIWQFLKKRKAALAV